MVVKKISQSTEGEDFYLIVLSYLRRGCYPTRIAKELNISKQSLNYYISRLKRLDLIKKLGYGVWDITSKSDEEVKKIVHKSTKVAKLTFEEKIRIPNYAFRRYLKSNNLDYCIFCYRQNPEIHHVVPKEYGGDDSLFNLIPVCPNHHATIHSKGISSSMNEKIVEFQKKLEEKEIIGLVRGHAFQIKLMLPSIKNWDMLHRRKYLVEKGIPFKPLIIGKGGESINLDGVKIWLTQKSIIVYNTESYITKTAEDSKSLVVDAFLKKIQELEQIFKISLKIEGRYRFRVTRQHYAKMRDELAKQYNSEGKKLNVYSEKGLWFVIDNSFNLEESETVHPEDAVKDMDEVIIPFFNGLKKAKGFTPQLVLEMGYNLSNLVAENTKEIAVLLQDRRYWAENQRTHVEAIQTLSQAVKQLQEEVSKLNHDK